MSAAAATAAVVIVARRDAARDTAPLSANTPRGDAVRLSARTTYGSLAYVCATTHAHARAHTRTLAHSLTRRRRVCVRAREGERESE